MLRHLLSVDRSDDPWARNVMARALHETSAPDTQGRKAVLTGTTTPEDEPRPSTAPVAAEARGQFASSARGAQLARRHAVRWLEEWGHPPASDVSRTVALVVGELAANAVRHGRVPGHDFGLRLTLDAVAGLVRVEVADAAAAKRPPASAPSSC